jgi:hypothetical protein
MLSAQEEGRLRDIGVQLDLEEVAGAQLAAANAQELQAQAMRQGMEGVTSLGGQIASTIPLFARNRGVEKLAIGDMSFTTEEFAKFENVSEKAGLGAALDDGFTNLDLQAVSSMSNPEYNRFVRSLTPKQRTMLFTNPQFLEKIGSMSPGAARLIR